MIKLNIRGFDMRITFGFFFTVSILILIDSPSVKSAAIAAYIVHELGHCFAAVILNVKFSSLRLWAGGVSIQLESRMISYRKELAVLISGPLFNMIFSAACIICGMHEAAEINLILALFNLLPYSSLDGGCIIKDFFDCNEMNGALIQKAAAVTIGAVIVTACFGNFPGNVPLQASVIFLVADEFT